MSLIQVFDPAMCCNTGVCGTEVDQQLVTFAADVDWAKQNGAQIERFASVHGAAARCVIPRSGDGYRLARQR